MFESPNGSLVRDRLRGSYKNERNEFIGKIKFGCHQINLNFLNVILLVV